MHHTHCDNEFRTTSTHKQAMQGHAFFVAKKYDHHNPPTSCAACMQWSAQKTEKAPKECHA
eukprot:scaffold45611_cov23-Tisochrysis_lutea.AAC.1